MRRVAIIRFLAGLLLIFLTLWAPISLLAIGLDRAYKNKHIKDIEGPRPDEVRDNTVMAGQFVTMNIINLMAGGLAGIGTALFVDNGRLRWPSSPVPIALIVLALILAEFTGMAILAYIARPASRWVRNPSVFRSYLKQLNERGQVSENDLADIQRLRSIWSTKTNVWPLRKRDELEGLKLVLPMASKEWASSVPYDPVQFGVALHDQVSRRQVRSWIFRKRLLRLGIPPFVSGFALAVIIWALVGTSVGLKGLLSVSILISLVVICIIFFLLVGFQNWKA